MPGNCSKKIILLLAITILSAASLSARAELFVTIIEGLGGNLVFAENFHTQSQTLADASESITDTEKVSLFRGDNATRENLLAHFSLSVNMNEDDRGHLSDWSWQF